MSAILSSSTMEIASTILFAETSYAAWSTLEHTFSSQSTARSMNIRSQLNNLKKLDSSITSYFNKAKTLADTLTSIGQPLSTTEFTSYILNGLDDSYDSLFESVLSRDTPLSIQELYARLLSTEQRIDSRRSAEIHQTPHSASFVRRGGRGS